MATSAENAVGTEADAPARGSAPPSKYDTMTVYDPATRTVRDAAGAVVAPPTLAELSAMPGDAPVLDRPYECEPADDATVALLAKVAGLTVAEYAPNLVKKTIVGAGHCEKIQIRLMVKILLPKADPHTDDAADALAVAVTHAHHRQSAALRAALR